MLRHDLFQLMGGQGIQPHKGLVHEDQLGIVEQGGDEGDLLLHAVGAVGDGLGQVVGHAQELAILPDAGGAVCLGHAVYVGHKVQVLQAGEEIVQVWIVRYVGKLLLAGQGLFLDGMPGHKNIALGQLENAAAGFQRGGFPAPLWPMKPKISPGAMCRLRSSTAVLAP